MSSSEYQRNMESMVVDINYDTALLKQFVILGGVVKKEGSMLGAIIGKMPDHYCGAFEKTRAAAINKCMHNWYNEEA